MDERNTAEILQAMSQNYRGQIRLLDMIQDLQREVREMKKTLHELEGCKGCGCHC